MKNPETDLRRVTVARCFLRQDPDDFAPADSEMLYGHPFIIEREDGDWAYGTARSPFGAMGRNNYAGWVKRNDLSALSVPALTHRIITLRAPIFAKANIKSAVIQTLHLGALVGESDEISDASDFIILPSGYLHRHHVAPVGRDYADDFVAVAEAHLGLPYIWAGISTSGLDCSGLIMSALRAAGADSPRDASQQEAALGIKIADDKYKRGDLIFWPGHVGVMVDGHTLLHANAHHMCVATEPLSDAVSRVGPIRTIRRI